jgi:hypothetical protein
MMSSIIEQVEIAFSKIEQSQQKSAKIAGAMFLCLILLYFTEQLITSHIDSATVKRITELSINLIYLASTLFLIFSLYQILKPVHKKLAQLAMYWRLGEALIIFIMMIFSFEGKAHTIGFNISSILFSIGSFIFFYLFFKSRYIPKLMSVFGLFASIMITIVGFGILIFPNHSDIILPGWIPMLIAEITIGTRLLFKGLRSSHGSN